MLRIFGDDNLLNNFLSNRTIILYGALQSYYSLIRRWASPKRLGVAAVAARKIANKGLRHVFLFKIPDCRGFGL